MSQNHIYIPMYKVLKIFTLGSPKIFDFQEFMGPSNVIRFLLYIFESIDNKFEKNYNHGIIHNIENIYTMYNGSKTFI